MPTDEIREVIVPGKPGFILAGGALASPRRRVGTWPYQWLYPGPNSRHVRAAVTAATPFPAGFGTPLTLADYTVPNGYRFSLRGIVANNNVSDWIEGDGNVVFNLVVRSVGSRNVDYLQNVTTRLGSSLEPWPILGRLEFQSGTRLVLTVTALAVVTVAGAFGYGMLLGHEYPNPESGQD
jgi:hypothetical protein